MIDTHLHLWDLNRNRYGWLEGNTTVLNKTYLWEDIEPEISSNEVKGVVLVQADNHFGDTDFMLENARKHSLIRGVVGWLPLLSVRETEEKLAFYSQNSYFKGIRHLIHDEKNSRWLLQPSVMESLELVAKANLSYDVVGVLSEHLECAMQIAEKIPSLRLVLDHLNKPGVNISIDTWKTLLKRAASYPNIYVKISGLGDCTQKPFTWTAEDIKPWIDFVIETFGVERCMIGSDYPVALLSGSYSFTLSCYKECILSLVSDSEAKKIFSTNATSFYRLTDI
ncbi:MAG: amidohydrolase family protein [Cytophagales bacterium]|nr:amidohydrolase family protein [Cytophagales bacterium]MDW8384590.1 amidohydrolase family protein [Flammeovirgaceae bacterium]